MVGYFHILFTTHIARLLVLLTGICSPLTGGAAVTGIHVESRTLVMDGHSFGAAGAYEKITGRVDNGIRFRSGERIQFFRRCRKQLISRAMFGGTEESAHRRLTSQHASARVRADEVRRYLAENHV